MKTIQERQRPAPTIRVQTPGEGNPVQRGRSGKRVEADGSELVALDPVIHERTRLAILTALATAAGGALSFIDLREALQMTDGNLVSHLRTLEEAGILEREKKGAGRGSSTLVQLTNPGRQAFTNYLDQLELLVRAARGKPRG